MMKTGVSRRGTFSQVVPENTPSGTYQLVFGVVVDGELAYITHDIEVLR
jgi:hypothetical protein